MLLSVRRPSEMLRIRLPSTAGCVSEMSYYAAERLLFKRIHVQIFFQTVARHALSFHYHPFFSVLLEISAEPLCN